MPATMHDAIFGVVAARRLGSLAASRQRFTVSREQALLQLRAMVRARSPDPWDWTLPMVRAANALSELAEIRIAVESDEASATTTFDVIVPDFELDRVDLSDMLAGALAPDLGEPLGLEDAEARQVLRLQRFRMLMGRAINEALAGDPIAIELQTPAGGRRFERREQVQGKAAGDPERDPYAERKTEACVGSSRFVVRWVEARPGWGTRLGRWLRGRSELTKALIELWTTQMVRETDDPIVGDEGQVLSGPALARPPIALGRHALFGPSLGLTSKSAIRGSLWLIRDGFGLVQLDAALLEHKLPLDTLAGWVDCPTLRLTADEQSVVRDAAFELLVAWLYDVLAHRQDSSERFEVHWPEGLDEVIAASGRSVRPAELAADARHDREQLYVWRHRIADVPAFARDKPLALWPSELDRLRARFPEARLVPLRALGNQMDFEPVDLTSLRAGSHEPLVLARDAPVELPVDPTREGNPELHMAIEAYVHRSPTATMGFIELLAYERRIANERAPGKVIPGVTLIVRISPAGRGPDASSNVELDVPGLRRAYATTAAILEQARRRALEHREALLAHVLGRMATQGGAWENPLVRGALDELGGPALELGYKRTDAGLRLAWKDSVLLDVVVARDAKGADKTLRDALRQLREPGMIVFGKPDRSWPTLRSSDPRLEPWLAIDWARPLLERVVGAMSIVDMPAVPEAHPLVGKAIVDDQRHLLRTRETIAAELGKRAQAQGRPESRDDRLARLRLLGHLLVARGLEHESFGLEGVPLLDRYDPRALSPSRMVSLQAVLTERPRPGLVPLGMVHRGLSAPVLEVGPGVAALLHEVAGLEPHVAGSVAPAIVGTHAAESRGHAPVRRRARELPPLLARSIVHSLFVGRLQVAGDGGSEGIALWSKGLRIGEIELEEPLGRVSGRLWLTLDGSRSGPMLMRKEITELARSLVADALQQRALLAPEGAQRRRLDHFVEYARAVVGKTDRYQLAPLLGIAGVGDRAERIAQLKQMSLAAVPLRPLQPRRDALLADVVKQALAMPVRFDAGLLQWRPAKLGKRRRDGSIEIEFGLRNAWIQRALDENKVLEMGPHREAALLAGVIVLAEFFSQARAVQELELGPEHLVVALWRLLKLT
ncbi:hypothetical protein ACNOYE_11915 [Nannocystaceae bacterium ST9]